MDLVPSSSFAAGSGSLGAREITADEARLFRIGRRREWAITAGVVAVFLAMVALMFVRPGRVTPGVPIYSFSNVTDGDISVWQLDLAKIAPGCVEGDRATLLRTLDGQGNGKDLVTDMRGAYVAQSQFARGVDDRAVRDLAIAAACAVDAADRR